MYKNGSYSIKLSDKVECLVKDHQAEQEQGT